MATVSTRRTNFQREMMQKMQNFRFEVAKKDENLYEAKVAGQEIAATGPTESDAVRNVRELAKEMFKDGRLSATLDQRMI